MNERRETAEALFSVSEIAALYEVGKRCDWGDGFHRLAMTQTQADTGYVSNAVTAHYHREQYDRKSAAVEGWSLVEYQAMILMDDFE